MTASCVHSCRTLVLLFVQMTVKDQTSITFAYPLSSPLVQVRPCHHGVLAGWPPVPGGIRYRGCQEGKRVALSTMIREVICTKVAINVNSHYYPLYAQNDCKCAHTAPLRCHLARETLRCIVLTSILLYQLSWRDDVIFIYCLTVRCYVPVPRCLSIPFALQAFFCRTLSCLDPFPSVNSIISPKQNPPGHLYDRVPPWCASRGRTAWCWGLSDGQQPSSRILAQSARS